MNLKRVQHFVALAETLHFGRAAKQLHMAQPPLSVSIQKLEAELGARLFLRTPSGVTLTPSGEAMLVESRGLLLHAGRITEAIQSASIGGSGHLQIGFVGSATQGMLQRLIPKFRAQCPAVQLTLREGTSARIVQLLENDEIGVGIIRTPLTQSAALELVPLEQHTLVAALPADNFFASRSSLQLSELAAESFVMYSAAKGAGLRSAVLLACQQAGFLPRISQEAAQIQTVLALVESGLGIALIPSVMRRVVGERICYQELTDLAPALEPGLALAYKADTESPAAQTFRHLAYEEYRS